MKVYNLYVSVRPINAENSSFTMVLHYCNCTDFDTCCVLVLCLR